jgi:uncharacterized protein YneF (UPF0154 family)
MFKQLSQYFNKLEGKIRNKLSHHPTTYAFIGSVGIVLIWRGIWHLADDINMPSWVSLVLGVFIAVVSGLFVSFFVGERIIISGLKREKRVDQKTEEEIKKEEGTLLEIEKDVEEIKEELDEIKKDI